MERINTDNEANPDKTATVAELAGFRGYGSVVEAARALGVSQRTIYRLQAGMGSPALREKAEKLAREKARNDAAEQFEPPPELGMMVDRVHGYLCETGLKSQRLAGGLDVIIDLATAMSRGEDPRPIIVAHIEEYDGYVRELLARQQ